MLRSIKARVGVCFATGALALGLVAPAGAQPQQDGLVNVNVSGNNVQVPIGVAANVCGVNAAVLATGPQSTDPVCNATVEQLPRAFQ